MGGARGLLIRRERKWRGGVSWVKKNSSKSLHRTILTGEVGENEAETTGCNMNGIGKKQTQKAERRPHKAGQEKESTKRSGMKTGREGSRQTTAGT